MVCTTNLYSKRKSVNLTLLIFSIKSVNFTLLKRKITKAPPLQILFSAGTPVEKRPYVLKVADSESDIGLHVKALVLKILIFIRIRVTCIV